MDIVTPSPLCLGVVILSVNFGDTVDEVKAFLEEKGRDVPVVRLGNKKAGEYSVSLLFGTSYVVGRDGKIAARFTGTEVEMIEATFTRLGVKK